MKYTDATRLATHRISDGVSGFTSLNRDDELLVRYRLDLALEGRVADSTIEPYWYSARHFLRWLDQSSIPLEGFRKKEIDLYRYHLATEPARQKKGSPRSSSTVYRMLVAIKHFCRWAMSHGYIPKDPWKGFSLRRPQDRQMMPLTMDEIVALVRGSLNYGVLEWEIARTHALVVLVVDLGLRIKTEALALDRIDVESSQGLRDQFTVGSKGTFRDVPLDPVPAGAIRRFLDLRTDDHPALFVTSPYRVRGRVRRFEYRRAVNALKFIGERCGLDKERVTWHNLRRTSATQSLLSGVDLFSVMALYGWRRVETVQRYVGAGARREALATHSEHSLAGRILGTPDLEVANNEGKDRSLGGTNSTAQYRYAKVAHDPWNSISQD